MSQNVRALQVHEYQLTQRTHPASAFLQQTLVSGYPRLLRLFHQFFSRIAVQTDTVYSDSQQRWGVTLL